MAHTTFLKFQFFLVRNVFQMRAGPDRTAGVVQDFGRNGTKNESPETPVAMRWQHDQIETAVMREIDNLCAASPCKSTLSTPPSWKESGR